MTAEQTRLKVLQIQLYAQIILEDLEDLQGVEPIWKQDAKAAGNLAIKACEKFVKRIGDNVQGEQTEHYMQACKILRENMRKGIELINE